jgi:ribosomal protein S18 acetylase RimI-like enzyme
MSRYMLIPINNFFQAIQLKDIRNQCRSYMTNDTSRINFVRQIYWFYKVYKKENREKKITCYLFKVENKVVGFGVIRKFSNKFWITGGLKQDQRGKGIGKILFGKIIENVPASDVWLEVLRSNIVAHKLYQKLGFKKVQSKSTKLRKIILMKLIKDELNNEKI